MIIPNFCFSLEFEIGEMVYIVDTEAAWQIIKREIIGFSVTQRKGKPLQVKYEIASNNFWPSEKVFKTPEAAADWMRDIALKYMKEE